MENHIFVLTLLLSLLARNILYPGNGACIMDPLEI